MNSKNIWTILFIAALGAFCVKFFYIAQITYVDARFLQAIGLYAAYNPLETVLLCVLVFVLGSIVTRQ